MSDADAGESVGDGPVRETVAEPLVAVYRHDVHKLRGGGTGQALTSTTGCV